VILVMIKQ